MFYEFQFSISLMAPPLQYMLAPAFYLRPPPPLLLPHQVIHLLVKKQKTTSLFVKHENVLGS